MSKSFTPIKIGKEFPEKRQGKTAKYFFEDTVSLLTENIGDVFLVEHLEILVMQGVLWRKVTL